MTRLHDSSQEIKRRCPLGPVDTLGIATWESKENGSRCMVAIRGVTTGDIPVYQSTMGSPSSWEYEDYTRCSTSEAHKDIMGAMSLYQEDEEFKKEYLVAVNYQMGESAVATSGFLFFSEPDSDQVGIANPALQVGYFLHPYFRGKGIALGIRRSRSTHLCTPLCTLATREAFTCWSPWGSRGTPDMQRRRWCSASL